MPYPQNFLRVTLRFVLPNSEQAMCSYSLKSANGIANLDDATADGIAARCLSFWQAILAKYTGSVQYIGCSVTLVGVDGKSIQRIDKIISPNGGTQPGNPLPNEVAVCVSLRTANAGRRTRGRFYLPAAVYGRLDANGRWDSSLTSNVSTAAAALLAPLVVAGATYNAVVASSTGSLLTQVTSVGVGDVPDSQRRRRDKQLEAYTVTAVT